MKRAVRGLLVVATCFTGVITGCLEPSLAELGSRACSDEQDQDGDDLVDCTDPDCTESGVCEHFDAACSDGKDNDGDAKSDCADPDCQTLNHCMAHAATCSPLDEASCPFGLGCYASADGPECRPVGDGRDAAACSRTPRAAHEPHDCADGYDCDSEPYASDGLCGRACSATVPCIGGSVCRVGAQGWGQCSTPCLPAPLGDERPNTECPPPFLCLAGQTLGITGAEDGHRYRCASPRGLETAQIDNSDELCVDPFGTAPTAQEACVAERLCVGTDSGDLRCRALCIVDDSESTCLADEVCSPLSEPAQQGVGGLELGVCIPIGAFASPSP